MSDTNRPDGEENWARAFEGMNDAIARSMEQNMEAQTAFMDSWFETVEGSMPQEEAFEDGMEGYERASEVWMDAAEQMADRVSEAARGEDVEVTELRDIWLQSANEAFSEVMGTSAFAAGTGQLLGETLELQEDTDELTQDTLSEIGFATSRDVDEVAERLVELERRQHELIGRIDDLLEERDG